MSRQVRKRLTTTVSRSAADNQHHAIRNSDLDVRADSNQISGGGYLHVHHALPCTPSKKP
jgi:hypothetical protein